MKIISWNVNGIRAALKKEFIGFLEKESPEIICIQETKAHPEQVEIQTQLNQLGYNNNFWNSAEKKGYSGTAIFSKIKPINTTYGINKKEHNNEGRVITLEFENFFLINVYTPNSQRGLTRIEYRQEWDKDFLEYTKKLNQTKEVIFCGDLNVAHKEIDIKNHATNKTTKTKPGSAGFTDTERENFTNITNQGFTDIFRHLNPDKIQYTWWSYMFNSRANNTGWRIDYFMLSKNLINKVEDIILLNEVMGSDHCPISLKINL